MRNQALFNELAILTKESAHRYNQGTWGELSGDRHFFDWGHPTFHACETRACIAGNAVILSTPPVEMNQTIHALLADEDRGNYCDLTDVMNRLAAEHGEGTISGYAEELLGLTCDDARTLFAGDWYPRNMEVHEALAMIGEGFSIDDVTFHTPEDIREAEAAGYECVEDYEDSQREQDEDEDEDY